MATTKKQSPTRGSKKKKAAAQVTSSSNSSTTEQPVAQTEAQTPCKETPMSENNNASVIAALLQDPQAQVQLTAMIQHGITEAVKGEQVQTALVAASAAGTIQAAQSPLMGTALQANLAAARKESTPFYKSDVAKIAAVGVGVAAAGYVAYKLIDNQRQHTNQLNALNGAMGAMGLSVDQDGTVVAANLKALG